MSLSGRRGGHATAMLNCKRKRSPLPKTRCASPIMSVFASMSTKQGQATFPKEQPFSPSVDVTHVSTPKPLHTTPKPSNAQSPEEAAEEQDKYPCLRRALSCTETPILPLGTYAVEFGFDVSTLPFSPHRRSVFSLPEAGDVAPRFQPSSQSPPEPQTPSAKPNCDKSCRLLESATASSSNSASNLPCCSVWHGHDFRGRIPSSSSSTTDASTTEEQPFHATNRQFVANYQPHNRRPPEHGRGGHAQSREGGAETAAMLSAAELQSMSLEQPSRDTSGDTCNRNEPADALYATVWKKDKRAWLWKAGNKTGQPGSHDHYLVAKHFKKDNRTWLWKSSSKKLRTDVDT